MKLKNKLPHFSTLLGIVMLVGICVGMQVTMRRSFPEHPKTMVLDRPLVLHTILTQETIKQLRAGEEVRFLGIMEGEWNAPTSYLVETQDGQRGLLYCMEMGYQQVETGDEGGLVTIKSWDKKKHRMTVVRANGEEKEKELDDIRPILPDTMQAFDIRLNEDGDYYMTRAKFDRLYMGKSFAQNEVRYRPAWEVKKTKKGFDAYYPCLEVVNLRDGKKYNPIIHYDAKGIAVGCDWNDDLTNNNNRKVIPIAPMLSEIIDNDFLASFIEGTMYMSWMTDLDNEYSDKIVTSLLEVSWYRWLGLLLFGIFGFMWLFLMLTLPSLLAEASLYCRWTYYFLPDWMVKLLFFGVFVVSLYVWIVLIGVWGFVWQLMFMMVVPAIWQWRRSVRFLGGYPHQRCVKCRRMEVNDFRNKELNREYDEWRPESKEIDSSTQRWQSWTDVTWSNGSHTRENVRNHARTTTVYADYEVYYHVKEYIYYYECRGCKHVETVVDEDLTELDRRRVGQHTSVSEY